MNQFSTKIFAVTAASWGLRADGSAASIRLVERPDRPAKIARPKNAWRRIWPSSTAANSRLFAHG